MIDHVVQLAARESNVMVLQATLSSKPELLELRDNYIREAALELRLLLDGAKAMDFDETKTDMIPYFPPSTSQKTVNGEPVSRGSLD